MYFFFGYFQYNFLYINRCCFLHRRCCQMKLPLFANSIPDCVCRKIEFKGSLSDRKLAVSVIRGANFLFVFGKRMCGYCFFLKSEKIFSVHDFQIGKELVFLSVMSDFCPNQQSDQKKSQKKTFFFRRGVEYVKTMLFSILFGRFVLISYLCKDFPLKFFLGNIWWLQKKYLPLQPQTRNKRCSQRAVQFSERK